jgi:hypothetical protein
MIEKADVLAHRGWWDEGSRANSRKALGRALEAGFGIETDLRDFAGRIVVSHDPPKPDSLEMDLEDLLRLYLRMGAQGVLALNIKSDGLAGIVCESLSNHGVINYFVFDMSVPDTRGYLALDMPVFTRWSEYENGSLLDDRASGLWLDCFEGAFVSRETLAAGIVRRKPVALVSPELHRRPHLAAWQAWKEVLSKNKVSINKVMICTDFPDSAFDFFSG